MTAIRSGLNYFHQEEGLSGLLPPIAAILAVWSLCELPMLGRIYANAWLMGRYIGDIVIVAAKDPHSDLQSVFGARYNVA